MPLPPELRSLLESLPEPRILVDMDYRILAANAAYQREFGNPRKLIGRTCYDVSHHFDKPCDQCGESCPRQTGSSRRLKTIYRPTCNRPTWQGATSASKRPPPSLV